MGKLLAQASATVGKLESGKDGQTTYTWLKYADTPTLGMSDDPTGKAYIGLAYNKLTPTESTSYSDYQWTLVKGADGKDGSQGVPGTPGKDGQPNYTWVKYGTSATGAGLSDDPTGKTYIGLAYNKTTATESTVASDYTWSLFKGDQGVPGKDGSSVTVTSTSIQYALSDSGTSTPTSWLDTPPEPEQGRFMWSRTTTTFSDGKSAVTYGISFSGSDGKAEDLSAIISSDTPPDYPKENQFWNDTSVVPNMLKVYRSGKGWVVYQFSAENIASKAITTDKIAANAVKADNIDMSEVTYQVADSSKNLAKNTAFADETGQGSSSSWTLPSGVTLVTNVLGDTNGILIPAGTTATLVNDLWDATDATSAYVLGLWAKSTGTVTVTVNGVSTLLGGKNPFTISGDGNWDKQEIKYTLDNITTQLSLTVTVTADTYLARVMLARRDTKLGGMWLPAPEDGMLSTTKINEQVTQNFSLSNGQLKSVISNLNSGYSSNFTQNANGTINQITKGNDLVTAINTTPSGVYIKGDKIQLDGNVGITQDFYAKGGNFKNLNASNITSGIVKADYLDVATIVAQGLSTTNATIGQTLTIAQGGSIQTGYNGTDSWAGYNGAQISNSINTSVSIDRLGFDISTNVTSSIVGNSLDGIMVGNKVERLISYSSDVRVGNMQFIATADSTVTSPNTTGSGTNRGTYYTSVLPFFVKASGNGDTSILTPHNLRTPRVDAGDLNASGTTNVGTINSGNISAKIVDSGPIRMNGYNSIYTTDGTGLYLAGGSQNGGSGVQVADDLKVTGYLTTSKGIEVGWDITKNGTGFHPAHFNNLPGIHIQGTNSGISFDEKNKFAYFILGNTWYRMQSSASGSGNWDN